jgi:peptidyl-prolyl cis-trans isomerase A (cyclophilin A)
MNPAGPRRRRVYSLPHGTRVNGRDGRHRVRDRARDHHLVERQQVDTVGDHPRHLLVALRHLLRVVQVNARGIVAAAALVVCALPLPCAQSGAQAVRVRFETALGAFEVELDTARAPATVANFLRYVDGGFYDGGRVHRSARLETQATRAVKIEVIQAGINPARERDGFPPIPLERTDSTGIQHRDGVISMARSRPDTAASDFFICIGDQPSLDFGGARNPDGQGFAAFGHVVSGLDVVRAIHQAPAKGETLTPPVAITRVRRQPLR